MLHDTQLGIDFLNTWVRRGREVKEMFDECTLEWVASHEQSEDPFKALLKAPPSPPFPLQLPTFISYLNSFSSCFSSFISMDTPSEIVCTHAVPSSWTVNWTPMTPRRQVYIPNPSAPRF